MGGKSSTRLVLKKPKTESSIRKVWIPRTLAFILREWKEKQDKLKEFMGDDYIDTIWFWRRKRAAPVKIGLLEISLND